LRTPLTSLIQGLELILDGSLGNVNKEQEKILHIVHSEVRRFSRLIEDMIDISRIQFGKMRLIKSKLHLNVLAKEIANGAQKNFKEKGLFLDVNVGAKDISVYADEKRMRQVITNFLENALRFTETGGVYLQVSDLEKEVIISVKDTGPGVKEQDQEKLFKKFQQFARRDGPGKKGTGLGLAICKGILDLEELAKMARSYSSVKNFVLDLNSFEDFKGESVLGYVDREDFLVLSTVHQAKGLEWETVFIIGFSEYDFPHPRALNSPEDLEEERRLFYVATTRTKSQLYIIYPQEKYTFKNGLIMSRPSMFYYDLPQASYEEWNVCDETSGL